MYRSIKAIYNRQQINKNHAYNHITKFQTVSSKQLISHINKSQIIILHTDNIYIKKLSTIEIIHVHHPVKQRYGKISSNSSSLILIFLGFCSCNKQNTEISCLKLLLECNLHNLIINCDQVHEKACLQKILLCKLKTSLQIKS